MPYTGYGLAAVEGSSELQANRESNIEESPSSLCSTKRFHSSKNIEKFMRTLLKSYMQLIMTVYVTTTI